MKYLKQNPSLVSSRICRVKSPRVEFYCPLCRSPRGLKNSAKLSIGNYLQITALSAFCIWVSYPLFKEKVFFWPLLIWTLFELGKNLVYRGEIPCPHCGFDATQYKRDVKLARAKVQRFWQKIRPQE